MSDTDVNIDDLIRDSYAVLADPQRVFDLQMRIAQAQNRSDQLAATLQNHFGQVTELFDAVHLGPEADFSQMGLSAEPEIPPPVSHEAKHLVLDHDLRIAPSVQPDWMADIATEGAVVPEWVFGSSREKIRSLRRFAKSGQEGDVQYVRLYTDDCDDRGIMTMGRIVQGDAGRSIEFARVALEWDNALGGKFADTMGLSATEALLTSFIIDGRSINDFAEERDRSVGTARNQMKAILRKLGIGSQNELVTLYAGFVNSYSLHALEGLDRSTPALGQEVTLPSGVQMRFERYGKAGGRPVIYLHSAIHGPFVQPDVEQAAHAAGLELFVPWMPFYAENGMVKDAHATVDRFVSQLEMFCGQLRIERSVILASNVSCAYGFAAGAKLPHLFAGMVAIALPVPLNEATQDGSIHPLWRAPLALGRRAPAAVDLLVRAVARLAMRGEAYQYFDRLLADSPVDSATIRRPDFAATVRKAFANRPDKAQKAMSHALLLQCLDWSEWLNDYTLPIRVLIGAQDTVHSAETQIRFCERHGFTAVGPLPDVGGFTLYQVPQLVLSELNALLDGD